MSIWVNTNVPESRSSKGTPFGRNSEGSWGAAVRGRQSEAGEGPGREESLPRVSNGAAGREGEMQTPLIFFPFFFPFGSTVRQKYS